MASSVNEPVYPDWVDGGPEWVPILRAGDILHGRNGPGGADRPHCLSGWLRVVTMRTVSLRFCATASSRRLYRQGEEWRSRAERILAPGEILLHQYNDATPKRELARLWNDAMRKIGYTEVQEY